MQVLAGPFIGARFLIFYQNRQLSGEQSTIYQQSLNERFKGNPPLNSVEGSMTMSIIWFLRSLMLNRQ